MKAIKKMAILILAIPQIALADSLILNKTNSTMVGFIEGFMYNTVLPLLSIAALGALVWGGVNIIMAGGDDAKVAKGRTIVTYAIVGIILMLLAYAIIIWLNKAIRSAF